MKVFLTGGTGFVGASVLRELLSGGAEVRALARRNGDRRNLEGLVFDLVEGDLDDPALLTRAMEGCEWVFHVAAHYSLLRRDRDAIYRANVEGTRHILQAARAAGVKRVVHTSSVAAIGVPPDGAVADETFQTTVEELVSDYKKSKFLSEQLARQAAREGLPVIIVNPSTPIGPYDVKPTPTGEIVLRFLQGRMPAYVDTGMNLIHVRDVAIGHLRAAEKGRVGERYILGCQNLTLKAILDLLSAITGLPAPKRKLPHWLPIVVGAVDEFVISRLTGRSPTVALDSARMAAHAMYYDATRAVTYLGLPQTPIETALRDAVTWFRDHGYV
ncbi:MAG: hopanoid-associated sugar epimerase [Chloracidobacterium sp.]|uniref:NAD-dependent epimerase/dehydratase family protein n=1 Tax=Chloracidobacterium validum TaxID=2821543 RepID=A0ABX8BCC3_9BACT|nr:hopanoid-associated sugar epimerase [Chloracidobacterium validum]QUW04583.1 NAD-dependent epimerase/dehydratase family protein [Chloracidobacterium validum]